MKISILKIIIFSSVLCLSKPLLSQDGFSLGTKSFGIGVGQFQKYSGITFNLFDEVTCNLNGIHFSLLTGIKNEFQGKINGIDFSLLGGSVSQINGISVRGAFSLSEKINGFTINGLLLSSEKVNGLIISGILINSDTLNGLAISGISILSKKLNGVFISGISFEPTDRFGELDLNGVALAIGGAGFNDLKGFYASLVRCETKKTRGLTIAAINKTEDLKGVQIGLLNYAGNKKWLKWMPFINFKFNKNSGK